jgi:hypothetical protein
MLKRRESWSRREFCFLSFRFFFFLLHAQAAPFLSCLTLVGLIGMTEPTRISEFTLLNFEVATFDGFRRGGSLHCVCVLRSKQLRRSCLRSITIKNRHRM